jgi:hypothetical protein
MNSRILIDEIVRQTTVLIARLSTLGDAGSPLGAVANEVFLGLSSELEKQGVGRQGVADMFGMALRSYQSKVQRLGESATMPGVTLWSAVQIRLAERGSVTRTDLVQDFRYDEEISVRGVLKDLVDDGLVVGRGEGDMAHFRLATADELRAWATPDPSSRWDAVAALVWLRVHREGPLERARLDQILALPSREVDQALESLIADGRVQREGSGDTERFRAKEVLIPIGETAGWEAAVIDHHRAVLAAIVAKLTQGNARSTPSDEVGGTTLAFDLWPGHPREAEVRGLLRSTRATVLPLWDEVSEYNRQSGQQGTYQTHFYCGQYVVEEETE